MTRAGGVEDPISAIFDLSDRAAQMAPIVRRLYRYAAVILVIWLIIMAVVMISTLRGPVFLFVLAGAGFLIGFIALQLLRQTDRFFRDFVQRHRLIRMVREADPITKIPEGRTPVERLTRYLAASNPGVDTLLKETPAALRYRISLHAGKREVPFELVLGKPSDMTWRLFGFGNPGFAILARLAPDPLPIEELRRMEADALAVQEELEGAPSRLILLRSHPSPLSEDAYEYAVGHPVIVRHRFGQTRATLEVITENPDGTYDFVPQVLAVP
ncbi:MAG: hypothetical protein L3K09_08030 [Thermoplasmata archaeon]|nr:hypothetical protein [Thermoplasmata archaeon]